MYVSQAQFFSDMTLHSAIIFVYDKLRFCSQIHVSKFLVCDAENQFWKPLTIRSRISEFYSGCKTRHSDLSGLGFNRL